MRYFFFIATGALLLAVMWGVAFQFSLGIEATPEARFISEWYDRKEGVEDTSGPSLYLVGGSSGFFGVDTRTVASEIGVPSINFATHAALSLDYIVSRVKASLKPGDLVVLMLEYSYFVESGSTDVMMEFMVGGDAGYFRSQGYQEQMFGFLADSPKDLVLRLVSGLSGQGETQGDVMGVVDREMSELGNRDHHEASRASGAQKIAIREAPPVRVLFMGQKIAQSPAWETLSLFSNWCRENQIQVFAAFPPLLYHPEYAASTVDETALTITDQYETLGISVIGNLRRSLRPPEEFFDSVYHLNEEGKKVKTRHFVQDLKLQMNRDSETNSPGKTEKNHARP